jgi:hypothetical protein
MCLQVMDMFEAAFPGKGVLGGLEENDEEGDPGDDVLGEAHAEVEGMHDGSNDVDLDLDLGKMKL